MKKSKESKAPVRPTTHTICSAEIGQSPVRFVCGHGTFPNPCAICQGSYHNAVFDPLPYPAGVTPTPPTDPLQQLRDIGEALGRPEEEYGCEDLAEEVRILRIKADNQPLCPNSKCRKPMVYKCADCQQAYSNDPNQVALAAPGSTSGPTRSDQEMRAEFEHFMDEAWGGDASKFKVRDSLLTHTYAMPDVASAWSAFRYAVAWADGTLDGFVELGGDEVEGGAERYKPVLSLTNKEQSRGEK